VVFEIELIKQVEINVDYILMLVERYLKAKGTGKDKEIRVTIEHAVNASLSLRRTKDLIAAFMDVVSPNAPVDASWQAFVTARKSEELQRIIEEENLDPKATFDLIERIFRHDKHEQYPVAFPTTGTAITKILPPISRFSQENQRNAYAIKKKVVIDKLSAFIDRYLALQ
jgi:type I restriction enzyme R subunit